MTEKKTHSKSRKRSRWPWLWVLFILFLVIGSRLSLKTSWVHDLVKARIVSAAEQQLNASLHIGDLEGDLWKEMTLSHVRLKMDEETVASVDTLAVGYSIWTYFSSSFEVSRLRAYRPFVIIQRQDSVWNVSGWVKQGESEASGSNPIPVSLRHISIERGEIKAEVESLTGDSALYIHEWALEGSLDYLGDTFEASVSALSFKLAGSGMDSTVSVESQARVNSQTLSLEKLVVATGNSIIETSGMLSLKDSLSQVKIDARPLSWKDITAFSDEAPVTQDLRAQLTIRGNTKRFALGLQVNSESLKQVQVDADLSYETSLVLHGFSIGAERADLPAFTGNESLPVLSHLSVNADARLPFREIGEGRLAADLKLGMVSYEGYALEAIEGSVSLSAGRLATALTASNGSQHFAIKGDVNQFFEESPTSSFRVRGSNISPAYWMKNKAYAGRVYFTADVSGTGLYPDERPWQYNIEVSNSEFMKQAFSLVRMRGEFSRQALTHSATIRLDSSEIKVEAQARQLTTNPVFNYTLSADGFDLSEFRNLETFASSISGRIEGEGSGASLENLKLNSSVRLDSSVVNGEFISELDASLEIRDTVATVREASLSSTIADGMFTARLHLTDYYRTSNTLSLDVEVKDLRALAPLFGSDKLQAEGAITGELSPVENEDLQFTGNVNLANLNYDDRFAAESAEGTIRASITEEPQYLVDLNLGSPSFSSVNLQDFNIRTNGQVQSQQIAGGFTLSFSSAQEGEINQEGIYTLTDDSSLVRTDKLSLSSSARTLTLQQPFALLIKSESVQMDTLSLQSPDGASLQLAVPYADSLNQEVFLSGQNINLAVLQDVLLSESYVEGILSGALHVDRADTSLTAEGDLVVSEIVYNETVLDELALRTSIRRGYLHSDLLITRNGKEIVEGSLEVPFTLKKPSTIDDAFFDQSVAGVLRINEVALSDFEKLLERFGITETGGVLSFNGSLEGKAGMPKVQGDLNLDNAVLSGVPADSVTANLVYDHERSAINLNAAVNSLNQKAADVRAKIPFYIDLLTFEVATPRNSDPITISLETNDFKLAALNDFVDPQKIRDIRGRLDGMVEVSGLAGDLKTEGRMSLSKGSVRVVPAGTRISEMNSTIIFEPNQIKILDFSAKSGSGRLNAEGMMGLKQLAPGKMEVSITAKNFTAANTNKYKAVVNAEADINGTFTRPDISGTLRVLNGFVELDNFGEKAVENISLDSADRSIQSSSIYDSLSVDMEVTLDRRFYVRNERFLEIELELEGQVEMVKEASKDLKMFGGITTSSGYSRPLGKQFDIEEGQITFSGNPENPSLNVRSVYEPPQPEEEIKIWYIIEGTVENPKFKYESQPEMELQSIISYTLFGQPFYKLDSWQQVVANSGSSTTAADVAMDVLLDRVESLATRQLGIDVVKIDNTLSGGESGTSITTGWYISPKIFFAIQNVVTGSTPDTGFILEYKLQQNLKLILRQGNDSRQGIDLRWNHDY